MHDRKTANDHQVRIGTERRKRAQTAPAKAGGFPGHSGPKPRACREPTCSDGHGQRLQLRSCSQRASSAAASSGAAGAVAGRGRPWA